jgi:hypothetical protein
MSTSIFRLPEAADPLSAKLFGVEHEVRSGRVRSRAIVIQQKTARPVIRAPWREADMECSVADNSSQDHLRRIGYRIVARELPEAHAVDRSRRRQHMQINRTQNNCPRVAKPIVHAVVFSLSFNHRIAPEF